MDPFTWFLIALGIVIVGAVLWQMVRKPSRGVDGAAVSRGRGRAAGKAEYQGRQNPGSSDGGPLGGF